MDEITVGTLFGLGFMLLVTAMTVVIIWQVAVSIRARATVSWAGVPPARGTGRRDTGDRAAPAR